MERLRFNNYAEFGDYIYKLASEESQVSTAVLLCEDAAQLIRCLLLYDDVTIGSINIENEDYHGYDKEFYITLDADLILDVVPAYRVQANNDAERYLPLESDVVFYGGDVSSKTVLQSTYGNKYEIIIEDYDDGTEDKCGGCCRDCSDCPRRETSSAIADTLDLIDYIFNYLSGC